MEYEIKTRYIFYNDNKEIFVLFDQCDSFSKVYLPGRFHNFIGTEKFSDVLNSINIKNNLINIYEEKYVYYRYRSINCKLVNIPVNVTKSFYSCYVEDKSTFDKLYKFFEKYGLVGDMLSFDDVVDVPINNGCIENNAVKAIKMLSKKLNYELF